VLLEGVTVAAGAEVARAIVDAGASIEAGRRINGTDDVITVDGAGQEHP
jgi:ADP-glucose pyrophosphorylase